MRAASVLLLALVLAGCAGEDETDRELEPGRVTIGVVAGEREVADGVRIATNRVDNAGGIGGALTIDLVRGTAPELVARGIRLVVLPCRAGLAEAARVVRRAGAVAVAPCDDGALEPARRIHPTGLSPRGQADALERYLDGEPVRLLPAATRRGERVSALLRLDSGGSTPVSPDALEGVQAPPDAPEGAVFATYGFPDPGNRLDEFSERFRSVYGRRPPSVVAALAADSLDVLARAVEEAQSTQPVHVEEAFREGFEVRGVLGDLVFPGGTAKPKVEAAIVRLSGGRLRTVATL